MNAITTATHVALLARAFASRGDVTIAGLLRESGYFDTPHTVTEPALNEALRANPACVDDWLLRRTRMLRLPDEWGPVLASQPETGMGYQVASITLKNGTRWSQVLIESGFVTRVRGVQAIPFAASEIAEIVVTHAERDFESDR